MLGSSARYQHNHSSCWQFDMFPLPNFFIFLQKHLQLYILNCNQSNDYFKTFQLLLFHVCVHIWLSPWFTTPCLTITRFQLIYWQIHHCAAWQGALHHSGLANGHDGIYRKYQILRKVWNSCSNFSIFQVPWSQRESGPYHHSTEGLSLLPHHICKLNSC